MKRYEFLGRGALAACAALAWLAISPVSLAQQVSVNGTQTTCTVGTTSLQMGTDGSITINCTVSGTTVFSCTTPSANPSTVTSGGGVNVGITLNTSTCLNGVPASYMWAALPSGFTLASGSLTTNSITVTPPAALTTTQQNSFSLTVTPVTGAPWTSANIPLTVNAAGSSSGGGGGTAGCPNPIAISGTFTTRGRMLPTAFSIPKGGAVAFAIPASFEIAGAYIWYDSAYSITLGGTIGNQFAISTCPGDFSVSVPPNCISSFADTASTRLDTIVAPGSRFGVSCVLQPQTAYYLNVRNVNSDLTPSCASSSCSQYITIHN